MLRSPEGDEIECMVLLDFPSTNNEAEYEALVARLDLTKAAGAASVVIHCDSLVITNQVNEDYECKGERIKKYLEQVKRRVDDLQAKIVQIPRGENEQADHLAKATSAEHMVIPDKVLSFVQLSLLIDLVYVQEIGSESNWATPLIFYLKNDALPERLLPPIPKVFKPRGSRLCHEGSPRRDLREPLRVTVIGTQTDSSWILLAHYVEGCPDLCQNL